MKDLKKTFTFFLSFSVKCFEKKRMLYSYVIDRFTNINETKNDSVNFLCYKMF